METNCPSGIVRSSECRIVSVSAPEGTSFLSLYNSIMRKFISFSLTLLAAFILCACGNDAPPAPPAVAATTATPARGLPKIVALGDSLTAGYGLSLHESYPSLLQEQLKRDGFKYEVVNAGVSGDTSAGGLRRLDWALEGDVRFVILELGANDILRGLPTSETRKNLAQIIERSRARGAQVLLAGMLAPTNYGAQYGRESREVFPALAKEYDLPLIPFFLERVAGIENLNQPDGVHPNPEGTRIVAATVYQHLKPMLEKDQK
jgi:acyl-CoA thioesterase I